MRRLDRYIARNFVFGLLPTLLLLTGLFSFLALVQELEDVGKGSYTTVSALAVIALTLPRKLIDILPVVALLGALSGLGGMANHREIVACRASGMAPARMAAPVALMALLVIALTLLVQTFGIPGWERQALRLRSQITQTHVDGSITDFWTRTGGRLLRVGDVAMGRVPTDIEIYQLDDQDRLLRLIRADHADILNQDEWLLHGVTETVLSGQSATTTSKPSLRWRSFLSQVQLGALIQPANTLSPQTLLSYIHRLQTNHLNSHPYRFAFWQMLSLPIGILAMALLGVPFVMGSLRSVSINQRVALGGAIGMAFYLSEQVTGNLAVLYELNPIIAAMAPDLIMLTAAIIALVRAR